MRNCEIARGMNGGGGRQDGCMMLPTMARKLSMNIVPRGGGEMAGSWQGGQNGRENGAGRRNGDERGQLDGMLDGGRKKQ